MVLINTHRDCEITYENRQFLALGNAYPTEELAIKAIDEKKNRDEEHSKRLKKEEEDKQRLSNPFKIVLAQPDYLIKPIQNIKDLVNEVRIKITKDKLTIVDLDPANVAMVIFELYSSSAVEWDCKNPADISINVGRFHQMLKECDKNDILIFQRKDGEKNATLQFKGSLDIKFSIPFYDLEDRRDNKIPDLKFSSKSLLKMKDFKKIISFADSISETMRIEVDNGLVIFTAIDGDNIFSCSIAKDEKKEKSNSKMSIEYLKKFPCQFFEMVTIENGKDFPLKVSMEMEDRLSLSYILAPRVDNGE